MIKDLKYEKKIREKYEELRKKEITEKEIYRKEMEYYKNMLDVAGGMVQKTESTFTYIVKTYDDAPNIKKIKFSDV